jgi:hypothetical protein
MTLQIKGRVWQYKYGYVRGSYKGRMDMDHSKVERDDMKQANGYVQEIYKEGMEMDHSKMEGMKMDGMQEEVVTADSAKG